MNRRDSIKTIGMAAVGTVIGFPKPRFQNPTLVECISFLTANGIITKALEMNESRTDIAEAFKNIGVFEAIISAFRTNVSGEKYFGFYAWCTFNKIPNDIAYKMNVDEIQGTERHCAYSFVAKQRLNLSKTNETVFNRAICNILKQATIDATTYLQNCDNIFYHTLSPLEKEHLESLFESYIQNAHLESVFPEYPRGSQISLA